jgi:hypothetical protein
MNNLPLDVVKHILEFDERFVIRTGKIMKRICKDDYRKQLLLEIPPKVHFEIYNLTYVFIPINAHKQLYISYSDDGIRVTYPKIWVPKEE